MTTPIAPPIEVEKDDTNYIYFTFEDETFKLKRKFKRLKFLRLLTTSPIDALMLAFDAADLEQLEEREFTEDELEGFLEIIGVAFTGGKGN